MTTTAYSRPEATWSSPSPVLEREAAEDVFLGQVVMIWARWFLIVAGAGFFFWTSSDSTELALGVVPIAALMAMNFALHGRYLLERPSSVVLVATASVLDVVLVSSMVLFWHGAPATGTGLESPFFVLYYPVLIAFAFVMPRRLTVVFTSGCMAAYAALCIGDVESVTGAKTLAARILVMAAVGGLGTYYWRVQRNRRRAVAGNE